MKKLRILIIPAAILIAIYGFALSGCTVDPIKSVKNNPDRMEILMNHIANDDSFRAKMVERLIKTGDKQKLAENLCKGEDFNKTLLSEIMKASNGETDVIQRVANRRELISKAIERAMQMPEYREAILDALLANPEMVEFMKTSEKLKTALASASAEVSKEGKLSTSPKKKK